MKKLKFIITLACLLWVVSPSFAQSGLLNKLSKKVEQNIENRINQKVDKEIDRAIDKNLDKIEAVIDETSNTESKADATKNQNNRLVISDKLQKSIDKFNLESIPENSSIRLRISSENCDGMNWFKKGNSFEYETIFTSNKMDNTTQTMKILDIRQEANKTIAEIEGTTISNGENYDAKLHYICDGNKFYIDIESMIESIIKQNPQLKDQIDMNSVKNIDLDINNGFTAYPNTLYQGLKLDDANFILNTSISGLMSIEFGVNSINRVVVGKENITTKAGSFECMKIRSLTFTHLSLMGRSRILDPQVHYQWIAPKVGVVKDETYDHKNNLISSMQLTKFNN